ncbi:hypothetical protein ANCCAN_05364 [Ancylostoma caninum]|uniref:SCP domain-containing protein n=1 Tax=Ancylostoma caninum TaxID=29170 RepID=A0A368GYU5_ANCCA|nr:hypothetical protein ANCCAN_05364 [Ancylostoma caninum]
MEILIDEKIGECDAKTAIPAINTYGSASEMIPIKGSEQCDAKSLTLTTINNWWNEGAAKQAGATVTEENNFSQMARSIVNGFACSYKRCGGNLFLVCFYNRRYVYTSFCTSKLRIRK